MDLKPLIIIASGLCLAALSACSDSSSSNSKDIVPDSGYGTDGLDSLGSGTTPEPVAEPEPEEPVIIDQSAQTPNEDEEREWQKERESQSLLGRSRDKAKTLRNSIQGGTDEPEGGLAATTPDEEWVGTSGWEWDMPESWQMAIPAGGRFGEMYISSPTGAASVAFTKETRTVAELERQVGSIVVDLIGSKVTPKVTQQEVQGLPVKILALEGTYVDPSAKGGRNEKPFYAVRSAIVDLGDYRVLVTLLGPESTVFNNAGKFDAMIEGMRGG
ncbi:MAG: hypothetical protein AB8F26_09780 [Phycisphaerales bacterium]